MPADVYLLDRATERRLVLCSNLVAGELLDSLLGTVRMSDGCKLGILGC